MDTFLYERKRSMREVRDAIQNCEGKHVQQIAYSSYMDCLTQICFTCHRIRSTISWFDNASWTDSDDRDT